MGSAMIMSKDSQLLTAKCCIVSFALAAIQVCASDVQSGIDDFNPDVSRFSHINSITLQADGKVVVGGFFTMVGGQPRTNIARLHPDGSLDQSFNAWTPQWYSVTHLAVQSDGRILVVGNFPSLNGQARLGFGRLNADGSLDSAFNPQLDDLVACVAAEKGGKIVIGGYFTTVNGQPRQGLARLNSNGSLDIGYDPFVNAVVTDFAMKPDGTTVFAKRELSSDNVRMVCVSPKGYANFCFEDEVERSDDSLSAFAVQSDDNIVQCLRDEVSYFRRLTPGGVDPTFRVDAGLWAHRLVVQPDGKILAAGGNTNYWYPPEVAASWVLYRLNADGSVDNAFQPRIDSASGIGVIDMIVQPDGKILVGGSFTSLNGQPRNNLGRIIPTVRSPRLASAARSSDGAYQFSFTNADRAAFAILATTNVALPVAQWEVLGAPLPVGGGLYQFTDPTASTHTRRFYQLHAP